MNRKFIASPEMRERYASVREIRREVRFEEMHDIARSATPENAHAKRVLLDTIKGAWRKASSYVRSTHAYAHARAREDQGIVGTGGQRGRGTHEGPSPSFSERSN